MKGTPAGRRFGYAWVAFAAALAVHVFDEAMHDFLSVYNPNAQALRARFPFLPFPTFTFGVWLGGLVAGIALLFCLSPFVFRGSRWLRIAAIPLSVVVGMFNACLHLSSSVYFHRWMPGVYSSPILLAAAIYLFAMALKGKPGVTQARNTAF